MTPREKKKLLKLANVLGEAQALVQEILSDSGETGSEYYQDEGSFDAGSYLASLRKMGRSAAETKLADLKQHELGALFIEAGGPSADKKKPKIRLIEQILWRCFDFDRGHEAIRTKGSEEFWQCFLGCSRRV
jgi:hypothetical protein